MYADGCDLFVSGAFLASIRSPMIQRSTADNSM